MGRLGETHRERLEKDRNPKGIDWKIRETTEEKTVRSWTCWDDFARKIKKKDIYILYIYINIHSVLCICVLQFVYEFDEIRWDSMKFDSNLDLDLG